MVKHCAKNYPSSGIDRCESIAAKVIQNITGPIVVHVINFSRCPTVTFLCLPVCTDAFTLV